jgi:hypothetical protein
MNITKNIILVFIFSLFFSFSYYFLISKFIVYPTVIPMVSGGNLYPFADWSVIVRANICQELGYDVYLSNPCDPWGRRHVYGEILLHMPFVEKFPNFYLNILPSIFNYFFILAVLGFFNFKAPINFLTTIVILFSFPVILAIERANIDILIFILIVLLAYFKNKIFNLIILIFVTVSKFYPIVLVVVLFFEENLKKILINFLIFVVLVSLILFAQTEQILKIFENKGQFTSSGIYNYSLIGTIKFVDNFDLLINDKNYSIFLSILLLFLPSGIIFVKILKYFYKKKLIDKLNYNFFEDRLYIFSSAIILFCYFSFSNFVYREIFLIGLIPWILKMKIFNKNQKFFSFYYYLLIFKFLISVPITYIVMKKIIINMNPLIVFFKYTIDLYLVSCIAAIFLIFLMRSIYFVKKK